MSQTATDMATVTGVGRGGKEWGGEGRGKQGEAKAKEGPTSKEGEGRTGWGGKGRGDARACPLHIISGYATVQLTDINSRT